MKISKHTQKQCATNIHVPVTQSQQPLIHAILTLTILFYLFSFLEYYKANLRHHIFFLLLGVIEETVYVVFAFRSFWLCNDLPQLSILWSVQLRWPRRPSPRLTHGHTDTLDRVVCTKNGGGGGVKVLFTHPCNLSSHRTHRPIVGWPGKVLWPYLSP